ncbi:MAG: GNAT family N-acetyltransferase [Spirochaetaceae bacterium]
MSKAQQRQLTATWHGGIEEIPREAWNALARPLRTPLLEWEWLRELEASGSIAPDEGWVPVHLALYDDGGAGSDPAGPADGAPAPNRSVADDRAAEGTATTLVAAAPLYVKTHSMGEFVFDFAWADVAQQVGIKYYPKLIGMSPATPSTAYRFLIHPDYDETAVTRAMLGRIEEFCRENDLRTMAFNYAEPGWREILEDAGYTTWKHQSYQWINHGFESFEDYLSVFRKNQRKNIRKERRSVAEAGVHMDPILGTDAPDRFFSLMYDFYAVHNEQFGPWAAKFLNRAFFEGLADSFRRRILFVPAYRPGRSDPFAMSFLLTKGDQLFGRYWGAFEHIDNVHFDACYYTPIEWAIANRVRVFDPGMGSSHKVRRGFEAVENHSLHRFLDERMNRIMRANIDRVNDYEQQNINYLNGAIPFAADRDPRLRGDTSA